jgi:hypothetical protein
MNIYINIILKTILTQLNFIIITFDFQQPELLHQFFFIQVANSSEDIFIGGINLTVSYGPQANTIKSRLIHSATTADEVYPCFEFGKDSNSTPIINPLPRTSLIKPLQLDNNESRFVLISFCLLFTFSIIF